MPFVIDSTVLEVPCAPALLYVDKHSETSHKESLALLARYFKKEMRFDWLQFDQDMFHRNDFTGFLLLKRAMDLVQHEDHYPSRVIGGGIFVQFDSCFRLDWVWIHPFSRNRGILKQNWKGFQERFGQFEVAEPLSVQMSAFLGKHHAG